MPRHEYKVIPAPTKGPKVKGAKTPEARFAHALSAAINDEAIQGWEYVRADTLPMTERKGLTGTTTTYQNMMVFRRTLSDAEASLTPVIAEPTVAPQITIPARPPETIPRIGPATIAPEPETKEADTPRQRDDR